MDAGEPRVRHRGFFLHSDTGESENGEQEEFGFERLRALLTSLPADSPVDDISGAILRSTDEFAGFGNPAHDDRTLLVIRVTPDSPSDLPKMPVIY